MPRKVMLPLNWNLLQLLGQLRNFIILYVSHFLLETAQKLLEATLSKSLNQAMPRLQRILIRSFADHLRVSTSQVAPIS